MLREKLESDLKAAMLSGDKTRVEILKMAKSALLYKEVELGLRGAGLTDDQVIDVLGKEAKKRLDAAAMYDQAGDSERAATERAENQVISAYLPEQLSDEQLSEVVDNVVSEVGEVSMKDMGKLIGLVKAKVGSTADGSRVAQLVKQKIA